MAAHELKNIGKPDETRKYGHGQMELVHIGGGSVGRATFEPGWKWSNDVKPIAGTATCQAPHFLYQISGRMKIVLDAGGEMNIGPGDVAIIPPGHDAWVEGNESVVVIDWGGAANYAKS